MKLMRAILPVLHRIGLTNLSDQQVRDFQAIQPKQKKTSTSPLKRALPVLHAIGLTNLSDQQVRDFQNLTE